MVKLYELIFISSLILQISANEGQQQKISKNGVNRYPTPTSSDSEQISYAQSRPIPVFPHTYIAEGIITTPNTTIKQPIQVWCDGDEGIHRLDHYNGVLTTLRIQKKNETRAYSFFPITTEFYKNQFYCNTSTEDEGSRLDVFLPSLSLHRHCGEEMIQGVKTEKWCKETKSQKEIVYVQFKNSTNEPNQLISFPILITRDASCYSQQINFTKFSDSKPDTIFMAEPLRKGLKCMKSTEFDKYCQELSDNSTRTYGEGNVTLKLQLEDYINKPDTFDWRDYGAVSEVKDQGEDGPCWSFATTAVLESAYLIRSNGTQKLDLSEQALLDCAWGFGSKGHFGGDQVSAFQWIIKHGGIPTEEQYGPYLAKSSYCHADKVNLTASISAWGFVDSNRSAIKAALKRYGPLAVVIDGYTDSFMKYTKSDGIYNDPACGTTLEEMNHVVVLVGYGKQNGTEYWIIKNSWGTSWGDQGFAYVAIDNNVCGLMNYLTFVVIDEDQSQIASAIRASSPDFKSVCVYIVLIGIYFCT